MGYPAKQLKLTTSIYKCPAEPVGLLRVSADKTFFSVQGEGINIGRPAIFFRLQSCNLNCRWCDTTYTWNKSDECFWTDTENWNFKQFITEISQYGCKHLVITGGEPLLQQAVLEQFLLQLSDWYFEIETNGTIAPSAWLAKNCRFNVSPKLSNSGIPTSRRLKYKVLTDFNRLKKTTFKFVVTELKDLEEIKNIIETCGLDNDKIILMPEAQTLEVLTQRLQQLCGSVASKGWRILPRLQLIIWGAERRR